MCICIVGWLCSAAKAFPSPSKFREFTGKEYQFLPLRVIMIYILFAKGKQMDIDIKANMFTILFGAKSISAYRGNIQFHGNVLM